MLFLRSVNAVNPFCSLLGQLSKSEDNLQPFPCDMPATKLSHRVMLCNISQEKGNALSEDGTVLQVGSRPEWKDKEHRFRKDAELKLTGIPTIIHWKQDGMGARISSELEHAQSAEEANALVSEFISRQCQHR